MTRQKRSTTHPAEKAPTAGVSLEELLADVLDIEQGLRTSTVSLSRQKLARVAAQLRELLDSKS